MVRTVIATNRPSTPIIRRKQKSSMVKIGGTPRIVRITLKDCYFSANSFTTVFARTEKPDNTNVHDENRETGKRREVTPIVMWVVRVNRIMRVLITIF